MKVFSITGCPEESKHIAEKIADELTRRGNTVGIINKLFKDEPIKTDSDYQSANLVVKQDESETIFLIREKLSLNSVMNIYQQDYLILIGDIQINAPIIVCAPDVENLPRDCAPRILAYCSPKPNKKTLNGIPVIDSTNQIDVLVALIQDKVFKKLPYIDSNGCGCCGKSCTQMAADIVSGKASRNDCISARNLVKITINNKELDLGPFVEDIVESVVKGLLSPLKGYEEGEISVIISRK